MLSLRGEFAQAKPHSRVGAWSMLYLMIPLPGFRVDGLPHSAQHLQGAGVAPLHMVVSLTHQSPDQSWCCVELLHLQQQQHPLFRVQPLSKRGHAQTIPAAAATQVQTSTINRAVVNQSRLYSILKSASEATVSNAVLQM